MQPLSFYQHFVEISSKTIKRLSLTKKKKKMLRVTLNEIANVKK